MPADYSSTARALALPVSPQRSPEANHHPHPPPWTRRRSSQSLGRNQASRARGTGLRNKLIGNAEKLQQQLYKTVKKLTPLQRSLAVLAAVVTVVVGILFLVFNERIFAWLEPIAESWKNLRGGWLILWAMTFTTAFPPIIGYSTCITTAGFVYGFPQGWFVVASATIVGSLCSFLVSRTLLSKFVHRLVENDTRFAALSLVLKHDGLKLLCMIRLCPLPYSISNGAISTFETVNPSMFALATAIVTPKLIIHVFIGSRLAAIAKSGGKMDTTTKVINWASIIGGLIIGALTAWFIYSRTLARSREIETEERSRRRPAPRGSDFSDDPEEQATIATLLRNDQIDFLDEENDQDDYMDVFSDDDDDENAFQFGEEEEGAIGLNKQPPRR
ncbi:Tlg2-vesicle protein [Pseudocyphellaria aurata]|nr:Tlg2-vesicle protein [Pseudocyphellaria aurata]